MEGIDLVERKFVRMLEDAGVEVIDPAGDVFDPELMEAMMRVPVDSEEQDEEVAFSPGRMIPIAWNVWDGQNGEVGKQRAISRWYYLLLEPETPLATYVWPVVVILLAAGGEWFGLRQLRKHWANQESGASELEVPDSLAGGEAPS